MRALLIIYGVKKYYDFDKSVKSLAEKAEKTRKVNEESQEENKISLFPLKDSP